MAQNEDFIKACSFRCEVCGDRDLVPSIVTLQANYGSIHDGERETLSVCGSCMDWLFKVLVENRK